MAKRGQATLFVVAALVIAILVLLVFLVKPQDLLINLGISSEDVQSRFEECLSNKLIYATAHNNFIRQPNLLLAKTWLEAEMHKRAIECSDELSFKGMTITFDKSSVSSTASFDGDTLNSIKSVAIDIHYPMEIKKGEKIERLSSFSAGIAL